MTPDDEALVRELVRRTPDAPLIANVAHYLTGVLEGRAGRVLTPAELEDAGLDRLTEDAVVAVVLDRLARSEQATVDAEVERVLRSSYR